MKNKIINILYVLGCSLSLVIILLMMSSKEKYKIKFLGERLFQDSLIINNTVQLENKFSLLKIYENQIFVTSWEGDGRGVIFKLDLNTKKFNKELDLKKIVNKNLSITDYHFFKNEKGEFLYFVNMFDPKNVFIASENKLVDKYPTNHIIQRINFKEDRVFTTTWDSSYIPKYFTTNLHNNTTNSISFKYPYNKLKYPAILLDGIMNSDGNYITITAYAQNIVLIFNKDFNFIRSMNLNIVNPEFKFKEIPSRDPIIDPNNIFPNIHSDLNENKLYVLTNDTGVLENGDYYIDMYDLHNDKYIKSYKFKFFNDEKPIEFKISQNMLYLLTTKSLYIYEKN